MLTMYAKRFALAVTLLVASGCTTLSPTECLYGDWYVRGQTAKAAGLNIDELMRQQTACARHGIQPNRSEFIAGYRGLPRVASVD